MDTLHVFYQLVGHLEHLVTIFTRKELTGSFMFPDMDLKFERLSKSNHTLFALEIS